MTNKQRALFIAKKAHSNQTYGDIYPFIYHIHRVLEIAEELLLSIDDNIISREDKDDIIVSCILHDTIEDTTITYNDIKKEFSEKIAETVYAVTNEIGRNRKERIEKTYPKIKNNWMAIIVKICDRIANIEHNFISQNTNMALMYIKEEKNFVSNFKQIKTFPMLEDVWKYYEYKINEIRQQ